MSTHEYHDDPEELAKSQAARYELRDGDFWSVGKFITGFFVFAAVSFAISYFALIGISGAFVKRDHPINVTVMDAPRQMPAKTPLQTNITAHTDMEKVRARERELTESYGPSEVSKDALHIPVEAAMEKLAAKGVQGVTGPAPVAQTMEAAPR